MNILALDQARNGAWSVFNYESKELIACGTFYFPEGRYDYPKVVMHLEEYLPSIICAYNISAVFFEDISMQRNVQVLVRLAWLQGMLVNFCEKNKYPYKIITPSQWQNYCSARGRTSKEQKENLESVEISNKKKSKMLSIQYVKNAFGINTTNDNLADAICIGWYAVNEVEANDLIRKKGK